MFERFTEKAINAVTESQNIALSMCSKEVQPEHLLLAIVNQAKGVSLKLFRMFNINEDTIVADIQSATQKSSSALVNINFSKNVKDILKKALDIASKSDNTNILFEHLFLSLLTDKNSTVTEILRKHNFDYQNSTEILQKLVQKKIKRLEHPESIEDEEILNTVESLFDGEELADILDRAVAKQTTAGYEILGTEQILASILETADSDFVKNLNAYGLDIVAFEEKLAGIRSRKSEFSDNKKIIYTPNAFLMMNLALQTAHEMGSSVVKPEHLVLSILNSKKGIAYEIIKSLGIRVNDLKNDIIKPIEKQMPETLLVMKLAKEEARRIGRNVVGTEMFLLGILGEASSVASEVLNELGVTIKDARIEVENLVGYGNEYFDEEIAFTKRAKQVLERAWSYAKKQNRSKIEAVDLLLAITEQTNSIAMKVLNNLGVDSVEIKQGVQVIKSKND